MSPGRLWTASDLERLAELYPKLPSDEVARQLGRNIAGIYGAAAKLGLKKSREFWKGKVIPGGEKHRFKKGQVPANKGLRRPGWHAGRMKDTQFKKGQRSGAAAKNWVPVGTILADSEGYLRIKVREAAHGKEATGFGNTKVWPLYNRYLWERAKGPIPPKHLVVFKDQNRANCVIENLELISMAENVRHNGMWETIPRELAEVIHLNGVLKRKLREHGEKQNIGPA